MPSLGCKTRPVSADPSRYPSTRASISHNVSNLTNDACPSLLDTSTKFFITSTQQGFSPSVSLFTARKTTSSFNRTFYTASTPKRPATAKKNEENSSLNLSMALLEVTDEKGSPLVRPMKKLHTNKFHEFLYKFKQEKQELEQKITKLEKLEQSLKATKLRSTVKSKIDQSLLEKSIRRKMANNIESQTSTILESSNEGVLPFKAFRHSIISSALSTIPSNSVKSKVSVFSEKAPHKQHNILEVPCNMQQKSSPRNSRVLLKNPQQNTIIAEEKFVPYSSVNQNLIDSSRIEESKSFVNLETLPSEALIDNGKYFFTKVSREKGNTDREKDIRNAQLETRLKPHTLTISLSLASSPNKDMRYKSNGSGSNDRSTTIHSKRNSHQSRFTPERGFRKKNDITRNSVDSETLQELFESLTIQGSTVEPHLDSFSMHMNSYNPNIALKRHAWSAKIQRKRKMADKEIPGLGHTLQPNLNSENKEPEESKLDNMEGKSRARTVEWTLQRRKIRRRTEGTPKEKEEETQKVDHKQSQRDKEKMRRKGRGSSLVIEEAGKARLEGWDIVYTNENLEKGI